MYFTFQSQNPDEPKPALDAASGSATMSLAHKKQLLASLPKKKKSLRMKERKIRDNHRLRKLVTPKHALLAINELKGVNISDFTYTMVPNKGTPSYVAEATINGVAYKGTGRSKNASKTDVCDQALRDIMLRKMMASAKALEENVDVPVEDEVPIVTLVSYAIHKLFSDWESEGYCMKCAGTKKKGAAGACTCEGAPAKLQSALAALVAAPKMEEEDMNESSDDATMEEAKGK